MNVIRRVTSKNSDSERFLSITSIKKAHLSQFQILMMLELQILSVTQSETIQCNTNIVDEFQIICKCIYYRLHSLLLKNIEANETFRRI